MLKGSHHTPESLRKMSESRKGENNPNYGKHFSDEHRRRLSESHKGQVPWSKGRHFTDDHKSKISKALTGKHSTKAPWNKGRKIPKTELEQLKERGFGFKKGHVSWNSGLVNCYTDETLRKLKAAKSGENSIYYGKHLSEETRTKIAEAIIKARKRGCYNIKPNLLETYFGGICVKNNIPQKYTGDGTFCIGGMNPDYIDANGRLIVIEIYGNYFHKLPKVMERDKRREETFRKNGWKLLVLWEHELKELPEAEIVQRVRNLYHDGGADP